jgi:decaprenyl-phosphate phosphoribosyltransferase
MSPKVFEHIKIARPDHWFKNVFMLPGTALALVMFPGRYQYPFVQLLLGLMSTCLVASANYVINEYLDAQFDRFHPIKRNRPSVVGLIHPMYVILEYCLLVMLGLFIAWEIGELFLFFSSLLLIMGILYNVSPIRLKDRVFIDVLSESFNNPIRFLLGWHIVEKIYLPPSSVLLAYWFGGAFLMAAKRYAEYKKIDNPTCAGQYRRSFRFYSLNSLLLSMFFYAMNAALFLGIFLVKYRIEFILCFPFITLLFTWYAWYALNGDLVAESPERLYKKKLFLFYTSYVVLLIFLLLFIDIPGLMFLMEKHVVSEIGTRLHLHL